MPKNPTPAQSQASRDNGRLRGPTSPEAIAIIKGNAVQHGLSGEGLCMPHHFAALVEERMNHWYSTLRPCNPVDEWLAHRIVVETLRVEEGERHKVVLGSAAVKRAWGNWDEDRTLEALEIETSLGRHPARAARKLRGFKQGAELMASRWEGLGQVLAAHGSWDADQQRVALDLLGVPKYLRSGPTPLSVAEGQDPREVLTALVETEVGALKQLIAEKLSAEDEDDRTAAEIDKPKVPNKQVLLMERYLHRIHKRLEWLFAQSAKTRSKEVGSDGRSVSAYERSAAYNEGYADGQRRAREEAEEAARRPVDASEVRIVPEPTVETPTVEIPGDPLPEDEPRIEDDRPQGHRAPEPTAGEEFRPERRSRRDHIG